MTTLQIAKSLAKTIVNLKTANELKSHLRGKTDTEIKVAIALIKKDGFLWFADEKILYKL